MIQAIIKILQSNQFNNSFSLLQFAKKKHEMFSPAFFNIQKEPQIVQKQTKKPWTSAFFLLESHGRDVIQRAPRSFAVKAYFVFLK